jgi:hypothetical protein
LNHNSKNKANKPIRETEPTLLCLPPKIESSGWNFDKETRVAYRKIIGDPEAKRAFEKLTTGNKPISPAHLLLSLGELKSFPNRTWKDWDHWQDKWEYLERAVKSLRRIASKMQKYLEPKYRGPIPLPTWTGREDESYTKSHLAEQGLRSITEQLSKDASEIEQYCKMRREWLRKTPRKDRKAMAEKEHLVMFLRFVENRTGRPHTEDVVALLNVIWGTAGDSSEVTANELRKLSKRFSAAPRIAHSFWFRPR